MFAHFLKYFPIHFFTWGFFKKILLKSYKPWTKSTSYNVNHNMKKIDLKQKST